MSRLPAMLIVALAALVGMGTADAREKIAVQGGQVNMGTSESQRLAIVELCRGSGVSPEACEEAKLFRFDARERIVSVGAFAIDRDEVTWVLFDSCVEAGACRRPDLAVCRYGDGSAPTEKDREVLQRRDHPVICVDFAGARDFCRHSGGRLPTESEWILAAGGADGRLFPWGPDWNPRLANWGDPDGSIDGHVLTAPPGQYTSGASPFGVLDMAGNVWEWVERDQEMDEEAQAGKQAIRGGGFAAAPFAQRITKRVPYDPSRGYPNVGFRCAYPAP